MQPRFIFVIGGVLSGIGKGVVTASLGMLLKSAGFKVTTIKIDPYVNVDAGTLNPKEHGEVFVTADGGETDQDIGTYERFLNQDLSKDNSITTGKVYKEVIEKERSLYYGGRDVEVIPDVSNEVIEQIMKVAKNHEITIVEIGGTTGDIENLVFLYAARSLMQQYPSIAIIVSYVPYLANVGELKTKPTQHAIAKLRETGIEPYLVITRSPLPLDDIRKRKISRNSFIPYDRIIDASDLPNIYEVPILFKKQQLLEKVLDGLNLKKNEANISKWEKRVEKMNNAKRKVKIALVGKYVEGEYKDVYLSVREAIKHASIDLNVKPDITQISSFDLKLSDLKPYDALVIPGGFGSRGIEGILDAIRFARENNIPLLGLCYGLQLSVIEFARNVAGMDGANTTEIDPKTPYPVIDILPEQRDLIAKKQYGSTMRLGEWVAVLKEGTKVYDLYGKKEVSERHRHRYEVNPIYVNDLKKAGLVISGVSKDNNKIVEFIELKKHPFFIATQAHPELKSRFVRPHPLFTGLIISFM